MLAGSLPCCGSAELHVSAHVHKVLATCKQSPTACGHAWRSASALHWLGHVLAASTCQRCRVAASECNTNMTAGVPHACLHDLCCLCRSAGGGWVCLLKGLPAPCRRQWMSCGQRWQPPGLRSPPTRQHSLLRSALPAAEEHADSAERGHAMAPLFIAKKPHHSPLILDTLSEAQDCILFRGSSLN